MLFVKYTTTTSQRLRGDDIAAELGAPVSMNSVDGFRDGLVVFVKFTFEELMKKAKDQGCVVAVDVLDWFCYLRNGQSPDYFRSNLVDVVIVPNRFCFPFYAKRFPNARCVVIPHQWDRRLEVCSVREFSPGYIGHKNNCPTWWQGDKATEAGEMIPKASRYNLHIAVNKDNPAKIALKPATKVATAAGCLANVLADRMPSHTELLGDEYPYYYPEKSVGYVKSTFKGREWRLAQDIMYQVRHRTNIKTIAPLYTALEESVMLRAKNKEQAEAA